MNRNLFNTLHPMAESGPIFLPFGEWDYDGRVRQRLDKAHAEAIANELNARTARGEPGIPVYAGHPDVPELAARYPDKGALGWIVRAALANQDGREGLELAVEWDRDPGRGFRWFSPYWVANERAGDTWIVSAIASVGLVNNPNIPEFRLANEALANVTDRNGREHVDAGSPEGGQFAPGAGDGGAMLGDSIKDRAWLDANAGNRILRASGFDSSREGTIRGVNKLLQEERDRYHRLTQTGREHADVFAGEPWRQEGLRANKAETHALLSALHRSAIRHGLTWNPKSRLYE